MSLVGGDFDEVVSLAKLLASLVQYDSILVQVLCLADDRVASLWAS